jgi:hypothetical protein
MMVKIKVFSKTLIYLTPLTFPTDEYWSGESLEMRKCGLIEHCIGI